MSTLLQNVSIWNNQGSIFIHSHLCSSQESYLKIEALSNQVKTASEEIMIGSKKTQIHFIYSPNNAQDTLQCILTVPLEWWRLNFCSTKKGTQCSNDVAIRLQPCLLLKLI